MAESLQDCDNASRLHDLTNFTQGDNPMQIDQKSHSSISKTHIPLFSKCAQREEWDRKFGDKFDVDIDHEKT